MSKNSNIEKNFPEIGTDYKITSPINKNHNCIAFAADDYTKYWWPKKFYWPPEISEREDLNSFIACYKLFGYEECGMNSNFEIGYDKVAIYVDPNGKPTHAAKQFANENGKWKSKLSWYFDIEHTLEGLSGWFHSGSYGNVAIILKRKAKELVPR